MFNIKTIFLILSKILSANIGPPICFHCGTEVNLVAKTDAKMERFEIYQTVRPICHRCLDKGLEPSTRGKNYMKKQKTN